MKPIFRLENYEGNVAMVCRTIEEAMVFSEFLDSHGRLWNSGSRYTEIRSFNPKEAIPRYGEVCYFFNYGTRSDFCYAKCEADLLLKFSDFDWSKESVDINIDVDACMSII